MSRSNPTDSTPNPAVRFYEWDGANGNLRYYDREKKEQVDAGDDLTFILLDQLSTVKGWNDLSESGIYANEVKDTTVFPMTVKAFKGGVLAEGLYSDIKDKVAKVGGYFVASCYAACKIDGVLRICNLQFKGASLNSWVEFSKANRAGLYKKAIQIKGSTEGKKGKVTFKMPKFFLRDVSEETDKEAIALDVTLQEYLKGYFARASKAESVPDNGAPFHKPSSDNFFEEENPDRQDPTDYAPVPDDDETLPF